MTQSNRNSLPKISIITPFFNAERFLSEAIQSVLAQTYVNWELLLIDDGSTDSSTAVIQRFEDDRIFYFRQRNGGSATARNSGLSRMNGEYFCFLDADDVLPANSLMSRLMHFQSNPALDFVDGRVDVMDHNLIKCMRTWVPGLVGNPFYDLISLGGKSFFGLTWMIKRNEGTRYEMAEALSHSEDLLFFMELCRHGGMYGYTDEVILRYRNTPGSAMKNLRGLEKGYRHVYETIGTWEEIATKCLDTYRKRTKRIMFRSYLRKGMLVDASRVMGCWL